MFGLSTVTSLLCLAAWFTPSNAAVQAEKDKEMKAIPVCSFVVSMDATVS